jgi:hypothetical protein
MIPVPTSCRERLQPRDFEFISKVLAGGDRVATFLAELFEEADSLAVVLDQDKLLRAVLELPSPLSISPELYFYVIVRRGLKDAGITDLEIADYVAATLADHAGGGRHSASRGGDLPETDFTYHVDIIEKMTDASTTERFFLEVQCGNRFLVLTGLFPHFLTRRAARRGAPGLEYYEGVARQAFLIAGRHPLAEEFAVREVYRRLGDCFSETRRALNRMAEERMFLGA